MQRPSHVLVHGSHRALLAFTVLRVVVGGTLAIHGFQKAADPAAFTQRLQQMGFPLPEVSTYLAIAGELLGGLGLLVGFLTPVAALGIAATMFVAAMVVNLKNGFFVFDGGFEYPLVLFFVALYYMAVGPGPYSLDAMLRAAREERSGRGTPYSRPITPAEADANQPPADVITQAGQESFPASDPPAHHNSRAM
jgi:putative oxidoreductase